MTRQQFNQMYNTAIQKIAVGFYILDTCGPQLGFDPNTITQNKKMLCGILGDGINMSLETIYYDANCIQLKHRYIQELRRSGLLEELIQEMRIIANENNLQKRLQNA
jgi:hypothetical protein